MNVLPAGLFERGDVLVGVRPEHLRIVSDGGLLGDGAAGRAARPRDAADLRRERHSRRRSSGCRRRRCRRVGDEMRLDGDRGSSSPVRPGHRAQGRPMKQKWRDAPIAVGMLAAVGVILGVFVVYPAGPGHPARPSAVRRHRQTLPRGRVGSVRRRVPQQRVPARTGHHDAAGVDHGADRAGARHRPGRAGRQAAPRHRFFRTVFSSTVATSVAVASLVWFVLLQPEVGVLADLFHGIIPSLKNPGLLQDPVRRCRRSRSAASGPTSGSRSSS